MKTLKFNHQLAQMIISGKKTSTWRINDEKNLSVDDDVLVVDKVDRVDKSSWLIIGTAHINQILAKRLGEINNADFAGHETYASKDEMMATFRGYYGDDINEKTTVKIVLFDFHPKKPRLWQNSLDTAPLNVTEVKLFTDGGSRGNPGPSASGYVVLDMNDKLMYEGGLYLGITTNNQAEYRALKIGLEEASKRGAKIVYVYMDSMLVVNQMKGIYKIKNADIIPLQKEISQLASTFQQVTYTHVPRELNKLADSMVNEILDAEPIDSR